MPTLKLHTLAYMIFFQKTSEAYRNASYQETGTENSCDKANLSFENVSIKVFWSFQAH